MGDGMSCCPYAVTMAERPISLCPSREQSGWRRKLERRGDRPRPFSERPRRSLDICSCCQLYFGIGLELAWLGSLFGWHLMEYDREIFVSKSVVNQCLALATKEDPNRADTTKVKACVEEAR